MLRRLWSPCVVSLVFTALLIEDHAAAQQASQQQGCVPAPPGLVSWWTGDDCTPVDSQGNHHGAFDGPPVCSIFALVGPKALGSFGGSTFVTVPDSPGLDLFATGMSVDMWFRLDSYPTGSANLAGRDDASGYSWSLSVAGNGSLALTVSDCCLGQTLISTGPFALPGSWHFVAFTVTPGMPGPTVRLYNNGFVDTLTLDSPFDRDYSSDLHLGFGVPGQLDEIELFNRPLSPTEIDAIQNAGSAGKCKFGCTPPPADMVSWWTGDDCTPADALGNHDGTFVGFPLCVTPKKVGAAALGNFGSGTYVVVPDAPALNLFAGGMSMDMWFRPEILPGALVYKADSSGYEWELFIDEFGVVELILCNSPSTCGVLTSSGPVATVDLWQFVGVSVTPGTPGPTVSLYNNGVVDTAVLGAPGSFAPSDLTIGYGLLSQSSLPGQYDEIELFSRGLSTSEFDAIYHAGTAGKCKDWPMMYCTGKLSSAGCANVISTSPSFTFPTSGSSDFFVTASGVQSFKNGLLFAGINGQAAIPFSGGTLCLSPPLKRGPVLNSGGAGLNTCTGNYAQLINDGTILPLGLDAGPGVTAWYQWWYRDPSNGAGSLGTALSNAVELTFQ